MLGDVDIVTVLHIFDQLLQFIGGKQEDVDDVRVRDKFFTSDQTQDVFRCMGEILDDRKPHETGTALDGMGGPKNLVDQINIYISAALFYGEKIVFNISEMFERFFDKSL